MSIVLGRLDTPLYLCYLRTFYLNHNTNHNWQAEANRFLGGNPNTMAEEDSLMTTEMDDDPTR